MLSNERDGINETNDTLQDTGWVQADRYEAAEPERQPESGEVSQEEQQAESAGVLYTAQQPESGSESYQAQQPESGSESYQAQQPESSSADSQRAEEDGWTKPHAYYQQQGRYASYKFSEEEPEKEQKKRKKGSLAGKAAKCVAGGLLFGLAAFGALALMNHIAGPIVKESRVTPVIGTTSTTGNSGNTKTDYTTGGTYVYDVSAVTESVMPSVVAIVNQGVKEVTTFFGTQEQPFSSGGSGVIVGSNEKELLIATNNHVVADADTLQITFDDNTTAKASIKGQSSEMDLAVVAVKLDDLDQSTKDHVKIATLGDSDSLKVGEPAIAIGNALGYGQSVTAGVISALDREVTVQTDSSFGFGNSKTITSKLIQTDAAINPGNSGGALFNINGEVVGINSVKYASTEVEGIGYAIPITAATPILDELMNRETKEKVDEAKSGYLGIRGANVTSEAQSIYGMPKGAYVVSVEEDSAAEKAGIRAGDIIVKLGDTTISSMENLQEELLYHEAGEKTNVIVQRNETGQYQEQSLDVTLGKRPDDDSKN